MCSATRQMAPRSPCARTCRTSSSGSCWDRSMGRRRCCRSARARGTSWATSPRQAHQPVSIGTSSARIRRNGATWSRSVLTMTDWPKAGVCRHMPRTSREADAEDDDAEDRAPKQGLMIPASMGLRFQVPADLVSFTVTASWGTYETVETDQVTKAGRPVRHYQRHAGRGGAAIALARPDTGRAHGDGPAPRLGLLAHRPLRRRANSAACWWRSPCAMTGRLQCLSR